MIFRITIHKVKYYLNLIIVLLNLLNKIRCSDDRLNIISFLDF